MFRLPQIPLPKEPRRGLLGIAMLLALLALLQQTVILLHWHSGPPNVLLITVDLLRPRNLPAYSSATWPMPNVAALAGRGTVFDHAYAQTSLTSEAHMSLLTSRYMSDIYGDRAKGSKTPVVTLGEILQGQRYRTAVVPGSSLLNSDIQLAYFRDVRFSRGFDDYFDVPAPAQDLHRPRVWIRRMGAESNQIALKWLSQRATPLARRPWFLHVNYRDLHGRYLPPGSATPVPQDNFPIDGPHSATTPLPEGYTNIHTYVDDRIGELLAFLKRNGMEEHTLVVLTADHCLPIPGRNGALYEDEIRVPLILAGPGIPRGKRVDTVVQNVDIAPTLVDVSGSPDPGCLAGRSLLKPASSESRYAFCQTWALECNMVTDGRWKYIEYAKDYSLFGVDRKAGGRELYDLEKDPQEVDDLVDSQPEVAARLRGELVKHGLLEGPDPLAPEQMKVLKPLDYW